ncbi:hypothetical protein, partial [Pseudomonas savastanoi]
SFLKEGTYQAAANTLGNSIAVIIVRYIPKWLKQRWNVRILRTFQTKLIVLATKGTPWHVAATDFLTDKDLFDFIIRQATEIDLASDPVSVDLKRYASELTEDAAEYLVNRLIKHNVILKLDVTSLAAIFLFAERRANSPIKYYVDDASGIDENSIITLSHLLHCAYDISKDPKATGAVLTSIAGLSIPQFQAVYVEALEVKATLDNQVEKINTMVS